MFYARVCCAYVKIEILTKVCQNDDMWCLLNNVRHSFQTWIRNLGFDLLLGFNGERRTDDGEPKKLTLGLINFLQVFAHFID